MQHSHIPDREQADAALVTFFAQLGHRPPATLTFRTGPRLAEQPVHVGLSRTVDRLRRATPDAALVRPLPQVRRLVAAPRIAAERAARLRDRVFNGLVVTALAGIVLWVGIPAAAAAVAGAL